MHAFGHFDGKNKTAMTISISVPSARAHVVNNETKMDVEVLSLLNPSFQNITMTAGEIVQQSQQLQYLQLHYSLWSVYAEHNRLEQSHPESVSKTTFIEGV